MDGWMDDFICPETKERSGRGYQLHGCATPTLTLPKTQRETHTLLSRQASLSLVPVGSQVTFLPSRVRLSLFVSLLSNHPALHALQGSSLCFAVYPFCPLSQ
jgi:hypothetical protein